MKIFQRWLTEILYKLGIVLVTLLIIIGIFLLTILTLEILSRAFLDKSILWVQELSTLLLVFMTVIGAAIMFINNDEIRITTIADIFPKNIQQAINIVGDILIIFLSINLIIGSLRFWPIVSRSAFNVLPFSTGINAAIMLIFSIVLFLCGVRDVISNIMVDGVREKKNIKTSSIKSEH